MLSIVILRRLGRSSNIDRCLQPRWGQQPDPSRLAAAPYKQQDISPVEYVHDAVPDAPSYLAVSGFRFPMSDFRGGTTTIGTLPSDYNQPRSSCFPYRCSLDATYESRFWTASFKSSRFLLQIARGGSVSDRLRGWKWHYYGKARSEYVRAWHGASLL